jgi:TIR domain
MANVFLIWSGEASHAVAQALYTWLPGMLQSVSVFMSSEDLRKGGRWNADLAEMLENTNFGIICLTRSNLEAPWILFEAGALSKIVSESHVAPLLIGVKPSDLPSPLTQFNGTGT